MTETNTVQSSAPKCAPEQSRKGCCPLPEQEKREDPQFVVESVADLEELLARAGNLAEGDLGAAVLAAEFRQARAYVADELRETAEVPADD